jgi:hypothetical protein
MLMNAYVENFIFYEVAVSVFLTKSTVTSYCSNRALPVYVNLFENL